MAAPKEQPPRKLSGKWTVGGGHSGKQAAALRRRLTEGVNGAVAGGVVMLSGPMTERGSASGRSDDGATDSVGGRPLSNGAGESPKRTPLHDLHRELGGKMVPFAGSEMPVQ